MQARVIEDARAALQEAREVSELAAVRMREMAFAAEVSPLIERLINAEMFRHMNTPLCPL